MKRTIPVFLAVAGLVLVLAILVNVAYGASSCTETLYKRPAGGLAMLTFDVTFHTDGTFTDYSVQEKVHGILLALETNPGSTAPTDQYDITLVDGEGLDVLHGVGANRATATTEKVPIVYGTYFHPPVHEGQSLTLKIANQAVNSATTKIILFYEPRD